MPTTAAIGSTNCKYRQLSSSRPDDKTVTPWRQEALAALIPGARRYVVDAGHDVVVDSPDLLLPVLVKACGNWLTARPTSLGTEPAGRPTGSAERS